MARIAVIDYGMGNLRSVAKALEHVAPRQQVVIAQDAATVASADRVVFPGQGAMPDLGATHPLLLRANPSGWRCATARPDQTTLDLGDKPRKRSIGDNPP
jgi:hypothetical protein